MTYLSSWSSAMKKYAGWPFLKNKSAPWPWTLYPEIFKSKEQVTKEELERLGMTEPGIVEIPETDKPDAQNNTPLLIGGAALVAVAAGAWYYFRHRKKR